MSAAKKTDHPDKHGHGGQVHALADRLGKRPEEILDFSASINPLGPPPGVLSLLRDRLESLLINYPEPEAERFSAALADHLALARDRVLVGNGATELIHLLPRLKKEGKALIIGPAFSEYQAALASAEWKWDWLLRRPEDELEIDPAKLSDQATKGYDLIFLARPANPDGAMASLHLVREMCQEQSGLVVVDEAFIDFRPLDTCQSLMEDFKNLVIIGSLTKFYALPGLRLGYLIADSQVVDRLRPFKPPWSVNALAAEAGLACLADPAYAAATRQLIERERIRLRVALKTLGLTVYPAGANFLTARLAESHPNSSQLAAALADQGILIRDCANYHGLDNRFFRISVRNDEDNGRLIKALENELT